MMAFTRAHFILLAVLLACAQAYAVTTPQTNMQVIAHILSQSTGAYVAVGLSLLIAALLYMGSSLFQDPKMSAQAKDTLYTSIGSLILIASLPALYFFTSTIVTQILLGDFQLPPNADMYDVSAMFLWWNQIFMIMHLIAVTIVNFYVAQALSNSYSVPVGAGKVVPIEFVTFARPLMFALGMVTNMLSFGIMITGFQLLFLNFIKQSILPVFLPLGVILRAFTPTMHAGNVLIGIAIGSYIITPAVFALDLWILSSIVEDRAASNQGGIGAMSLFYTKEVLATWVLSRNCPGINYLVDKLLQKDYSILDISEIENSTKEGTCGAGISPTKVLYSIVRDTSFWGNVVLGDTAVATISWMGAKFAGKFAGTSKIGKVMGSVAKFLRLTHVVSLGSLGLLLALFVFDIMYGVGVSMVIIVGILPFLNLTIIVLFMREFSQVVLGTPLNLSHLVRLI